ncbi:hypothetical protein KSS87_004739 [Heliosperma pusillum]|nr:hypothetical protein KSS87_004739 [Heliosperma pusillum]
MDPKKDLALCGYGSVSWKDRMEDWRKRQNEKSQMIKHQGENGGYDGSDSEDPDLPKYEKEGKPSELAPVDIFVSTVDPTKEPPLITANTHFSEISEFSRKWVPFCKKYQIEPRAPEWYFSQKVDYLKDKVHPAFVRERRAMKREYEEFKIRINGLVAMAQKVPEDGWTLQDGTPWPGNNVRDHPGMIQIRVSAILSNAPYILNVDLLCRCIHSERGFAMCSFLRGGRGTIYTTEDKLFSPFCVPKEINMKGLDGIHGPTYVGTGCVFRRQALYGFDAPKQKKTPGKVCIDSEKSALMPQVNLEKKFGQSPIFVASTLMEDGRMTHTVNEASLLREAIHVISSGYGDKSEWEKGVSWIYGSFTEDILNGFKMHCHGRRSVYCMLKRPAFKGYAPINLSDRLHQVLRWLWDMLRSY